MIRSCIRQAVRAFAGAALIACAVTAHAANLTISASNCSTYSIGAPDSNGNVTITCVPANGTGPLTGCSIQGSGTGTIGSNDTLTAVCSGGTPATNWTWSGGNCTGVAQQSCDAQSTSAGQITYSVVIQNGAGADANPSKQVTWSSTPPAKPTGCSITPSPSSLSAAGSVSLTAQCTGGGPVATWTWGGAIYDNTSGNTASATISSSTTFTVAAQNAGGTTNAQATVTVGGGGGGGAISCSGFLGTNVVNAIWPNWPNPTGGLKMPMGITDALVVKFTTGSTTSSQTGKIILFSGSGQDSAHDAAVSTTPCDFTTNILPQFKFTIGTRVGNVPVLQPNTTYYLNIRNSVGAVCTSGAFPCDLFMNLQKPSGM